MVKYSTNTYRYASVSTAAYMIVEFANSLRLNNLSASAMRDVEHILDHAEKIQFIEALTVIPGAEVLTGEDLRQIYAAAKDGGMFIYESFAILFKAQDGWRRIDNLPMYYTAKKMHNFIERWRRERVEKDTAAAAGTN
jgi:hypothetical protein